MTETSKKAEWEDGYEMEAEYDFSDGIPNPLAEGAFSSGTVTKAENSAG